jgi:hypothetical protein
MPTDQTPKKELNMPNTKTCPSLFFGESHSFRPWKGIVLGKWNQLNKYKTKTNAAFGTKHHSNFSTPPAFCFGFSLLV